MSRALAFPPLAAAFAALLAPALPATAATEKFVYLGSQPDGTEVHVQGTPPLNVDGGRRAGWFRTLPKAPLPINDETGAKRQYADMLAYNVADCAKRTMAASAMVYRDEKGTTVARFEIPSKELELRAVKPNTLGAAMLDWLCTSRKAAPPPPSPGTASPYK
jgi:hypothetical protein